MTFITTQTIPSGDGLFVLLAWDEDGYCWTQSAFVDGDTLRPSGEWTREPILDARNNSWRDR